MFTYSGMTIDGSGTNMHATTTTNTRPRARKRIFANAKPAAVLISTMTTTAAHETISELSSSRRIGWLENSSRQLDNENPAPSWYCASVLNDVISMNRNG